MEVQERKDCQHLISNRATKDANRDRVTDRSFVSIKL